MPYADKGFSNCKTQKNLKRPNPIPSSAPTTSGKPRFLGGGRSFFRCNIKWFKHETSALKDEKIQNLMGVYGPIAYTLYFGLCELCAEKIDENLDTRIEINWVYAENLFHSKRVTLRKLLGSCQGASLLLWEPNDKLLICSFPNLLKRLDNWTKRSVVTTEQLQSNYPINKNKKKNIEEEKELNISNRRFAPPTQEQATSYFQELNHPEEAAKFVDYFTANGWKISGRAPMRDWQAAARNWVRRSKETGQDKATFRRQKLARELKELEDETRDVPKRDGLTFGSLSS